MSKDGEYERGYKNCRDDLQPKIDKLEQELDSLKGWLAARLRVEEGLKEQLSD